MTKVITYGTFDLLHIGHIKLLERAKALGDYLIVGVTADDFDKARGKINVQQSLMERVDAVKALGIADEIIIEEYEGQKIDDIRRFDVDVFTVGSDWEGIFDYLKEYCTVVYLPRTKGISSSDIRTENRKLRLGVVGEAEGFAKFIREASFVNGVEVVGACSENVEKTKTAFENLEFATNDYKTTLENVDAVYIVSNPKKHYEQIKYALDCGKHVICESPIALKKSECEELFKTAQDKGLILMEAIKTAYSNAYSRLLLLIKSGKIGDVVSVDATCTSLKDFSLFSRDEILNMWNTLCEWGPTALLSIFQLLGTNYSFANITTKLLDGFDDFDVFTKIDFVYDKAVASLKIGESVKSEGELVISGTKGYIYVPAPWWKTDYFEVRYENPADNKRCFYPLDGEGIRYEIVAFTKAINTKKTDSYINKKVSLGICSVIEQFYSRKNVRYLK